MEFIARNQERANEFEEKLSKNMLYRSTDNFIAIYNNNLINTKNSEINKVAQEVVEVYKNITLLNRQFIIKSREEVVAEQFSVLFPHIAFIATLKRIANDILRENYPEDSRFVFTEEDSNIVQVYDPRTDEVVKYEGAERLKNANKAIATNPILQANVELTAYGEDGISFSVIDVLEIDTSFITNIGNLLEDYLES